MAFISKLFGSANHDQDTSTASSNDLALQKQLMQQIQSGQSPAEMFAANQGMAQNASLLGSMHGISPAAQIGALQRANAVTQGQTAGIGAAQELGRQQLLGQQSGQMYGQGLNYQSQQNAQGMQLAGSLIQGAAGAASMGMAGGGDVPPEQDLRAAGGGVPGTAKVAGDAPENDTVPAKLSPGEIVVPRSVAQAPDAGARAAAFVEAIKNQKAGKKPGGFAELLAKHRELEGRLARIERWTGGAM